MDFRNSLEEAITLINYNKYIDLGFKYRRERDLHCKSGEELGAHIFKKRREEIPVYPSR